MFQVPFFVFAPLCCKRLFFVLWYFAILGVCFSRRNINVTCFASFPGHILPKFSIRGFIDFSVNANYVAKGCANTKSRTKIIFIYICTSATKRSSSFLGVEVFDLEAFFLDGVPWGVPSAFVTCEKKSTTKKQKTMTPATAIA